MAFTLTKKPRQHRIEYSDGVALTFREFQGDERDEYAKQIAKFAGTKKWFERYELLKKQVAMALLTGWEGIEGEDGKPIECNDENKAIFFEDKESRKYWFPYINNYLNPRQVSGASIDDLVDGGEEPNFTATK